MLHRFSNLLYIFQNFIDFLTVFSLKISAIFQIFNFSFFSRFFLDSCMKFFRVIYPSTYVINCFSITQSLFSTTAFGLSFKYISRWEMQGIGAKWTNLFENPMSDDDFSVGWAIIFMLIDAFIYLTLTWYLEHVLPGRFLPNIFYLLYMT